MYYLNHIEIYNVVTARSIMLDLCISVNHMDSYHVVTKYNPLT